MTATTSKRPTPSYRLGLLVPLQEEYAEVCEVLEPMGSFTADNETFFELRTPGGHVIVAAVMHELGIRPSLVQLEIARERPADPAGAGR